MQFFLFVWLKNMQNFGFYNLKNMQNHLECLLNSVHNTICREGDFLCLREIRKMEGGKAK